VAALKQDVYGTKGPWGHRVVVSLSSELLRKEPLKSHLFFFVTSYQTIATTSSMLRHGLFPWLRPPAKYYFSSWKQCFWCPKDHLKDTAYSLNALRFTCCSHLSDDVIIKARRCFEMGQGWLTLARKKAFASDCLTTRRQSVSWMEKMILLSSGY